VERAELQSVENAHEFVAASGEKLTRLDQEFRELERQTVALSMERREEASETMQDFSERAGELRTQLGSLVDASAEEISDEREEIAEGISSLTASVKRELFELRQSVTMTSMRN
jgi:archaellum component FlaC